MNQDEKREVPLNPATPADELEPKSDLRGWKRLGRWLRIKSGLNSGPKTLNSGGGSGYP